jgi:hypothetical protein
MAAATNIVINDAVPAAHTFVPARKNGQIVEWEERTTSNTSQGFYTLSVSQTDSKTKSPVIRTKVSLAIPTEVLDSATGLYSYPSTARILVDVLLLKEASATLRADIAAYVKNLISHATIQALIADLDAPY